jgi:heat-inducible transcriptional repressor
MMRNETNETALNEREELVLEAVIRTYVETAEPAGSRTVAKRHGLGVSPATIRNSMSDLEDKGFLFHPHTSAGRIPTDRAYRYYVDTLMRPVRLTAAEQRRLRRELSEEDSAGAVERMIRRAAQVLGLLTGELGVAIAPKLSEVVLEKLELAQVSSERVLLVLTLKNGVVRTVYVDVPGSAPPETLAAVTMVLNERLAGLSLSDIRLTLPERLRDSTADSPPATELLNVFMQSAGELLDPDRAGRGRGGAGTRPWSGSYRHRSLRRAAPPGSVRGPRAPRDPPGTRRGTRRTAVPRRCGARSRCSTAPRRAVARGSPPRPAAPRSRRSHGRSRR